jgi:hypothetical protein
LSRAQPDRPNPLVDDFRSVRVDSLAQRRHRFRAHGVHADRHQRFRGITGRDDERIFVTEERGARLLAA